MEDFVIKKRNKPEMDGSLFYPENIFMNYLKCVE
jgi:hypothetical protein